MPKIEKGEASNGDAPPQRPEQKKLAREDRLEELNRKLARLNQEAELLIEAMRQKPKKS